MEQPASKPRWEAKVSSKLANASADQIWPFLEDFFGMHKYFPSLSTSYGIHGSNGEIGSIRYCEGFSIPSQESKENFNEIRSPVISWSREKLIAIDPIEKSLSYEMVDSNIGFNSYLSTITVLKNPTPGGTSSESGDDDDGLNGCVVEWSFSVDPVEGWRLEDLVKKYEGGLQRMAQKMEDALSNSREIKT